MTSTESPPTTPTEATRQSLRISSWGTVIAIGVTLVLLVIPLRVFQLQYAPSDQLLASIVKSKSSHHPLVRRGDLLDQRGRLLATTALGWRAFADPQEANDLILLGTRLQDAIDIPAIETDRKLSGKLHRRYVPVSDVLEDWQVQRLRTSPIRGIGLEPRLIRLYPQALNAASLIGAVGFEHTGLAGAEHSMNAELVPTPGHFETIRDAGRRTMWIPPDGFDAGEDGRSIRLSIDLAIQRFAELRLHEAVQEYGAGGGRIVVMDCQTGELLAVADVEREPTGIQPRLRRNRCVTDPYEPGSTFKPFVWAAATEAGLATPDETLPTPSNGPHRTSFGRSIRDAHYHGPTTWRMVLVKSLNSGMAIVAERMKRDDLRSLVAQLGFGQSTNCGIPGETGGIVTSERNWSSYTQTSVAMGHEIAVTPVQMAQAFCVFARDGRMPAATLHARNGPRPIVPTYVFTPEIAAITRNTMQRVMTEGTGRRAQSDHYTMFGKSGTAQLPKANGGGYHEDRYVSSFIAGAPVESPRIVVLCVIDDPDRSLGKWYGGSTAGPVVRDVVDSVLPYLGVAGDRKDAMQASR
ncbi:MAG: penicillin-binding protein 2 [Phycisphaerae bacterium]|jgi:cell division protein FtsI (penicillin-binding protein 3)|nr:penicillin-binding protein 2 [Phycisphaerae bacterium]MBT5582746.1 penicillin-binding protein 2 [Phycisphaerae bacterium]MBT5657326.1 penicillin-binding protein 2 [Phycisphaerae bacterium]